MSAETTVAPATDAAGWLALNRAPGLGPALLQSLLEHFSCAAEILAAPAALLDQLNVPLKVQRALATPDSAGIDADLAWLEASGATLLTWVHPDYPPLLREINDPPPVLFVMGDPQLLALPQLAIVGSRNPTAAGEAIAHEFAQVLAGAGLIITSGMAMGIDAAAHRGALSVDGGLTIAATGTGLDRVYPARHRDLAHQIAERGVLVSEFVPGTIPARANFPRRNRLISGLSAGTLVVEAGLQSGSLITARLATEQGREVFAVPGSIHNPLARGCHRLLRDGAKLVECAADVVEELAPLLRVVSEAMERKPGVTGTDQRAGSDPDPEYRRLVDLIGFDPVSVDLLVERSGLTVAVVSSMLLILELQGQVQALAGGRYQRCGNGE